MPKNYIFPLKLDYEHRKMLEEFSKNNDMNQSEFLRKMLRFYKKALKSTKWLYNWKDI